MAGKFKKGDVVALMSGGPAMTIIGKGKDYDNAVAWFNDEDDAKFGEYDDEVLLAEDEIEYEDDDIEMGDDE